MKDAVTALGKVKGTIDKPEAEGTFGLDKLAYDPLYITALSGKFLYKDGKLNIGDAIGNVYAGQVNVNGQIDTKTKDFKLEVQGIDLDSSVVTETQVDGPLSFKMLAIGTADAAVHRCGQLPHRGRQVHDAAVPFHQRFDHQTAGKICFFQYQDRYRCRQL